MKKDVYQFLQAQFVSIGEAPVVNLGASQQALRVVPDGLKMGTIHT